MKRPSHYGPDHPRELLDSLDLLLRGIDDVETVSGSRIILGNRVGELVEALRLFFCQIPDFLRRGDVEEEVSDESPFLGPGPVERVVQVGALLFVLLVLKEVGRQKGDANHCQKADGHGVTPSSGPQKYGTYAIITHYN